VLGGYKFPDAPIVDLRKSATVIPMRRPAPAPIAPKADERVKALIEQIPDDLSIPDFLRRPLSQEPNVSGTTEPKAA
jgi:hypothetical protein